MMKNLSYYNNVYRDALRNIISRLPDSVFSRDDLTDDHSNREQLRLNRALNAFMAEGIIVKIAHGIFAKAEPMDFPNGKSGVVLVDAFETVAIKALNKLGVKWEWGSAIRDYNDGKTTQVPSTFTVHLKSRFRGKISAEGRSVYFEGGVNGSSPKVAVKIHIFPHHLIFTD